MNHRPEPSIKDLEHLHEILLRNPDFRLGRQGIESLLKKSEIPVQVINGLSIGNAPNANADEIIFRLKDIGTLDSKRTHTALGTFAEYLLKKSPSLDDKLFLSYFITCNELIHDKDLVEEITAEYHHFGYANEAEGIDLGWKNLKKGPTSIDYKNLESLTKPRVGFLDTIFLYEGAKASPAVCRIETSGQVPLPIGTGFLIAPDLILTNYHVIPEGIKIADGAQARFHFRLEKDGKLNQESLPIKIVNLLDSSPANQLDFSLLQLESTPPNIAPLLFAPNVPKKQDLAVIVQHPAGAPQKFILDHSCIIAKPPEHTHPLIKYTTNTLNGSSGSPVFNKNWEVVALHCAGAPIKRFSFFKAYNEGVQIQLIQDQIKAFI